MILFSLLAIVLIVIGFFIGMQINFTLTATAFPYVVVILMAVLDCLLYSVYLVFRQTSNAWKVIFRLILEIAFGCFIVHLDTKSQLDLYLVALIPLGVSIFFNLQRIFTPLNHTTRIDEHSQSTK